MLDPIPFNPPEKTPLMDLEVKEEIDIVRDENIENNLTSNKGAQTELDF